MTRGVPCALVGRDARYPGTIVRRRTPTPSRCRLANGRASALGNGPVSGAALASASGQSPDATPGHPAGTIAQPIERRSRSIVRGERRSPWRRSVAESRERTRRSATRRSKSTRTDSLYSNARWKSSYRWARLSPTMRSCGTRPGWSAWRGLSDRLSRPQAGQVASPPLW